MSDAREYRRGSGRPDGSRSPARSSMTGASSKLISAGAGAATVQGNAETSKSLMVRVALQPRLMHDQNRSRPAP